MMGNRRQQAGRQPLSLLRMALPSPRRACWTQLVAIVLLLASGSPGKTARASVHSLGDITPSIPMTWSDGGSTFGGLEQPEERVLFRLARDQHLVLSIDPMPDGRSPGGAANMQASVWRKDGKLMGNLEGQPLRLGLLLGVCLSVFLLLSGGASGCDGEFTCDDTRDFSALPAFCVMQEGVLED